MIRINLLPEEYRRKTRTPLRMMAAIVAIVAVNGSLLAYWSWLSFGILTQVETQHAVLRVDMEGLAPQVEYHDELRAETSVYASRETTLAEITKNRILWTRKLDELIDVVNLGGDGVRHYIWLDDLTVKQETGGRGGSFGSLKAAGHSGSAKWDQVANFLEDVEDRSLSGFLDTFATPSSPEGTQNPPDPELIPSEAWSFPFAVQILSPEERSAQTEEAL
ncbi:MAG: hypothetical protein ACI8QZ_003540 [Chlamydiales bacterium]|jgi:hypothetical protein